MIKAELNKDYALRLLGVGIMMVAIAIWSLYDGMVAWPRANRYLDEARPLLLATNLTAAAWLEQGEDFTTPLGEIFAREARNPPAKLVRRMGELRQPAGRVIGDGERAAELERLRHLFKTPVYSARDLQTQYVQAAITFLLGLWAGLVLWGKGRRRLSAGEEGLVDSRHGGEVLPYAAIRTIDWSRWDEKGIAILELEKGGSIALDGWHYRGIDEMVARIVSERPELKK